MSEMGIDLSHHASQPLGAQLIRHADVIWTMTRSHRQAIFNPWPDASGRVHLLSMDGQDVPDPIGGPIDQYRRCAEQIKAELNRGAIERFAGLTLVHRSDRPENSSRHKMKIAIGCDHRGFSVKTKLMELVAQLGHEVTDAGAFSAESCDYPDVAAPSRAK